MNSPPVTTVGAVECGATRTRAPTGESSRPVDEISTAYRWPLLSNASEVTFVRPVAHFVGAWPGTMRQIAAEPFSKGKPTSCETYHAPSGPLTTSVGTDSAGNPAGGPAGESTVVGTGGSTAMLETCLRTALMELPPE